MKKLICIAFILVIIIACNKEDEGQKFEAEETATNYQPLNIGNYWIYEHFQIDTGNDEKSLEKFDSVFISNDTLIGNVVYYILKGTNKAVGKNQIGMLNIVRDSAGNIIDYTGRTIFSGSNFEDTLYTKVNMINELDTLYTEVYMMHPVPEIISLPAGNYIVIDYRGEIYNPAIDAIRFTHNYYAMGIGKVLSTYFFLSDTSRYFEKRLVRYYINDID